LLTVYPTETAIHDPKKYWNGYTMFQPAMFQGKKAMAVLIGMIGNVVNQWKGLDGFFNKILSGGYVLGSAEGRNPKYGF
jgi:hypothetical protein